MASACGSQVAGTSPTPGKRQRSDAWVWRPLLPNPSGGGEQQIIPGAIAEVYRCVKVDSCDVTAVVVCAHEPSHCLCDGRVMVYATPAAAATTTAYTYPPL
jgi:hypothetical protein